MTMEKKTEVMTELVEDLQIKTKEYLQPNPTVRAKMAAVKVEFSYGCLNVLTLSKIFSRVGRSRERIPAAKSNCPGQDGRC